MPQQPSINPNDPSILRQQERQAATGIVTNTTSGSETVFTKAVATTSNNQVTITQSVNNDDGDITTVYSTNGTINVTSIDQTINEYNNLSGGVSKVIGGGNIVVTSTGGDGTGIVTVDTIVNLDYSNSNVELYLPTYNGNLSPTNIEVNNQVNAYTVNTTYANIGNRIVFNDASIQDTAWTGVIDGPNVTGTVANANYASFAGTAYAVDGPNVSNTVANANFAAYASNITNSNQPNITAVGTLLGLGVNGNLNLTGNLNVTGNLSYANVTNLVVSDPIIYIGANNPGNTYDLGIVTSYQDPSNQYGGIARDHNTGTWRFFANLPTQPNTTVDWANTSAAPIQTANISANGTVTANFFTGDGSNLSSITGANVTGTVANANLAQSINIGIVSNNFSYHVLLSAGDGDKDIHVDDTDNLQYNPFNGILTAVRMDADYFVGNGSQLESLAGGNVTGTVANANYAAYAGNANTANVANSVAVGNVSGIGNIATINIDGNASNMLYGNGVFASIATFSGYSGFSGWSGISGFSGDSGISGFSGSGVSGFSGDSGISGFSGFSGQDGASGISGFSGFSGQDGISGISGFSGQDGISGYSGIDGASGISGFSGQDGISGFSGQDGISGYSGIDGASGFSGFSGQDGISGYSGIDGASGFSGQDGISGISGFSGQDGISGYSGIDGASGISGFSGWSGISGYSGSTGVIWSTAPVANTSSGTAGEIAYDTGGNLYIAVATNTWAKFTGTTSW